MKARLALVLTLSSAAAASAESAIDLFADGATTCVVRSDRRLACWGANHFGDPAVRDTMAGVPVTILGIPPGVTDISYTPAATCALTSDGSVHCWGNWNPGYPILEPGLETGVRAIARACAVTGLGSVLCDPFDPPSTVAGLEGGVADLAVGAFHSCALTSGGGVRCWGQNDHGQLGNGDFSWQEETAVDVVGLASGVRQVATGYYHSCALKNGGDVWCWGQGGRLGQPADQYDDSSVPLYVQGLPLVAGIAATRTGTCAVTSSGAVWCWGTDSPAAYDTPEGITGIAPAPIEGLTEDVVKIVAGWNHACALKSSGNVLCWGSNDDGQLGVERRVLSPVPVAAVELPEGVGALDGGSGCLATAGGEVWCPGPGADPMPDPPLTPIVASTSDAFLTSDGYLWMQDPVWYNPFVALDGVATLEQGSGFECALKTQGSVWCWGWANGGVLGRDTGVQLYNPYPGQVTSVGTGVRALALGSVHSCVITSEGGVRCWGQGVYGALGDGTTYRWQSAPVPGLESGVAALTAAAYHTCALTTGGAVWCWGNNEYGQLGDGTHTNRWTPVPVSGLSSGVAAVDTTRTHTCALLLDGSMRCWGQNFYGQLGDGTFSDRPTPVAVSGIAGGVHRMVLFDDHTCAVMTTGPAQCWGNDSGGQLADGGLLWRRTPAEVTSFGGAPEVPALGAPWLLVLACGLAVTARRRLQAH